jgi:hypothetical protein
MTCIQLSRNTILFLQKTTQVQTHSSLSTSKNKLGGSRQNKLLKLWPIKKQLTEPKDEGLHHLHINDSLNDINLNIKKALEEKWAYLKGLFQ